MAATFTCSGRDLYGHGSTITAGRAGAVDSHGKRTPICPPPGTRIIWRSCPRATSLPSRGISVAACDRPQDGDHANYIQAGREGTYRAPESVCKHIMFAPVCRDNWFCAAGSEANIAHRSTATQQGQLWTMGRVAKKADRRRSRRRRGVPGRGRLRRSRIAGAMSKLAEPRPFGSRCSEPRAGDLQRRASLAARISGCSRLSRRHRAYGRADR